MLYRVFSATSDLEENKAKKQCFQSSHRGGALILHSLFRDIQIENRKRFWEGYLSFPTLIVDNPPGIEKLVATSRAVAVRRLLFLVFKVLRSVRE